MQVKPHFRPERAPQNQPCEPQASEQSHTLFFEPSEPLETEKPEVSPKKPAPVTPKSTCPFPKKGPLPDGDILACVPFYVRNNRPTLREFEIW